MYGINTAFPFFSHYKLVKFSGEVAEINVFVCVPEPASNSICLISQTDCEMLLISVISQPFDELSWVKQISSGAEQSTAHNDRFPNGMEFGSRNCICYYFVKMVVQC